MLAVSIYLTTKCVYLIADTCIISLARYNAMFSRVENLFSITSSILVEENLL